MECCFYSIKKGERIPYNFVKLIYKVTSFNVQTLLLSILMYLIICYLIFQPAYFKCFEFIEIKNTSICRTSFLNSIGNILMYLFDLDNKMDVKPYNFCGVVLLILLKIFFALIIVNVLVKEFLNKIKLS